MSKSITLVGVQGSLYFPPEIKDQFGEPSPIVLCIYPEGDCDTINWPKPNMKNLERALYDNNEMGIIPADTEVLLPNGKKFHHHKL